MARALKPVVLLLGIAASVALWSIYVLSTDEVDPALQSPDQTGVVNEAASLPSESLNGKVPVNDQGVETAAIRLGRPDEQTQAELAWGRQGFHPSELYAKHLDKAKGGDLDAAYVLLTALAACRFGAKSEQQLLSAARDSRMSNEQLTSALARFEACGPLRLTIPDLHADHDLWYATVKEGRHPLFLLRQGGKPYPEKRALVIQAISQAYSEKFLYRDVYISAAQLYLEYPEAGIDENRYQAWLLLASEVNSGKEYDFMLEQFRTIYPDWQVREIVKTTASLRDAIRRGDWDALGL